MAASLLSAVHPPLLVLNDSLHIDGPRNMTALYNILGFTTARYSLLNCHPGTPPDIFANLLHCLSHSLPFLIAAATCSFHLNSLSICKPQNFTVIPDLVVCLFRVRSNLGCSILFHGLIGSFTFHLVRSNN